MKDEATGLKNLGSTVTNYQYKKPTPLILEAFENRAQNRDYEITLVSSEFTSLCPKTGQPDFAEITIAYSPNELCVETKSLKLYLFSFRQHGSFMEHIINKICDDLVKLLKPKRLDVSGLFHARGGITIDVNATYTEAVNIPSKSKPRLLD